MSQPLVLPYRVTHAGISDVGMRRANNQDAIITVVDDAGADAERGHFFMVADGMGAHAAGELASQLAVDNVSLSYRKLKGIAPPAALRQAVQNANERIHDKGQSSPEFHGMGTTCSCLVLLPGAALAAHVGDSRVYRARGTTLEQLTFDHSLVWEMAAASDLPADQMPDCIPKNVITRSLGPHETVNVDLEGPFDVQADDRFLLCSDGLSGVVEDVEIGAILSVMEPRRAAQTLVDLANLRGGPDNISVIVAHVEPPNEQDGRLDAQAAPDAGRIHALCWVAMAASLAALIYCGRHDHMFGELLAAASFGASIVFALMQRLITSEPSQPSPLGGPYGNGPHRRLDCELGASTVATILELVDELAMLESQQDELSALHSTEVSTNSTTSNTPSIDWAPFHACHQVATTARDQEDYAAALRSASEAIRTLMCQLRQDVCDGGC